MKQKQTRISDEVKDFIVRALACFDTPRQIIKDVKEEFGLDLVASHIVCYNPERKAGEKLSKKWRIVHAATREKFLEDVSQIPIANASYRLKELQRLKDRADDLKNPVLAASILEQAAKEVGGVFTNKHKLDHSSEDGTMSPEAAPPTIVQLVAGGSEVKTS